MTQAKTQTPGLLLSDDPEAVEANRKYQEALQRLTESLDTRKNRLFDPKLLAVTRGFLEPGAPDFFESLGRVAKNLGEAQFAQEKEDRDIAQMQLDVAGRGLELQRQKSLQALAARQMQQTGEPSGALPGGQRGFQIAPPDTNRMTGQQYYALAIARGVPPDEAMKGAAQIDRENIQVREGGVFNIREGRFYSTQYKEVPFQIGGKTYNLPEGVALELSHLARIGDVEGFNREARKAIRDFAQPAPAAPAQAAPAQVAPVQTAPVPAAPVQTAPVPAAVPPAQAQPAAPVSPQAVAPSQAAPAPSGGDQRIDLVGGIFTPPTKNADNRSAIEQAVETYRWSSRLAAGLDKRPILNDPWPPEDREKARILAEKTKKRLEESFGMKVVTPVEQSPSRAAIILAETPPSAASPARPAQAAPQPAARPAEPAAPVVQQAAPSAVAQAAPVAPSGSRLLSQEEIAARKRESEIKEAADKKRAEELAKAAAAKEAAVEQTDITARRTYESANKVLDYLKSSPNYFGVFARPGVVSAIGGFIEQGLRTPQGTIDLPGFRESITKLMPNVRQQDLDNVVLAAAELAEIELNFSRMYFQGQGAVTENERKIVRAIPGSVSNSPRVLRARMELLRDRAQYDIDVADAFRNWQEKNVGRSYLEFERESKLYKDIKKDFDQKAAKIFNGLPAMSTRERREAQQQSAASQQGAGSSASSVVQPSVGFIRDTQTGIIRRKRPGE